MWPPTRHVTCQLVGNHIIENFVFSIILTHSLGAGARRYDKEPLSGRPTPTRYRVPYTTVDTSTVYRDLRPISYISEDREIRDRMGIISYGTFSFSWNILAACSKFKDSKAVVIKIKYK